MADSVRGLFYTLSDVATGSISVSTAVRALVDFGMPELALTGADPGWPQPKKAGTKRKPGQ